MKYIYEYDFENDHKAFENAVKDFYYDIYFNGVEWHEYTDEEITMATTKHDIDDCVERMRDILYKHFDIKKEDKTKKGA